MDNNRTKMDKNGRLWMVGTIMDDIFKMRRP